MFLWVVFGLVLYTFAQPADEGVSRFRVDEQILAGLEYIYGQALVDDDHFAKYGHDYLMCVDGVISRTTNPLISQRADAISRALARKWKQLFNEVPEDVNASELTHLMFGLFALERVGLPFPTLKNELRHAMLHFDTEEFLRFNPKDEAVPANFPLPPTNPLHTMVNTREVVWYNALVNSYVAQKLRLPLGGHMPQYQDLLNHRTTLLPYKSLHQHESPLHAHDHLYALANLIWTLSDYATLRLRAEDFVEEWRWFAEHLETYLSLDDDPTAVAVVVDVLKIFGEGVDDNAHHHSLSLLASQPGEAGPHTDAIAHMSEKMQIAIKRLLASQNSDGSWGETKHGEQELYHPTCAVMFALCEHSHQGYGPSIPAALKHFKSEL